MSMISLLFYCLLFIFLLHRMVRKREVTMSVREIGLAFLLKVGLACLYGYVFLHYYNGDDTWYWHKLALDEPAKFRNDPSRFYKDFSFIETYEWVGRRFWPGLSAWIMALEKHIFVRTLALFNIFSGGNYYINTVFFNFIVFWGHYWLFSLLVKTFPGKRLPLLLIIFFFPPVLFWLSGIRADGLLLFFLGLLLWQFNKWLLQRKGSQLFLCVLAVLGILIFRNVLVLLLAPALLAWLISARYHRKPLPVFVGAYALGALLFFASAWISPGLNAPRMIAERQQEFMQLQGTRFHLDTLQPTVAGFAQVLPQAAANTFLRPYVWEAKGPLQIMTALEVLCFWLLMLAPFVRKDKTWKDLPALPLAWCCLFFGISLYLFIGYTVPFPGAIVRYKALGELLLLVLPVLCTRWTPAR